MKKIISVMLAVMMISAIACAAVSATVLFRDPFDTNTEYWFQGVQDIGERFEIAEFDGSNMLEGWDGALVRQAHYENEESPIPGFKSTYSSFSQGTVTVEVRAESMDKEGGVGMWWPHTYHEKHEGVEGTESFSLKYYPMTSSVKFMHDYPGAESDADRLVFEWKDPRQLGDNLYDPITLGLRIESGRISAFVDGQWIASYDDATLGVDAAPIVLWNDGMHALFDNYTYGDLAELPLPANATPTPQPTPTPDVTEKVVESHIETKAVVVGTDESGNAITEIVSEVVTEIVNRPSANGSSGNGGAQTGDMTLVVVAAMVVALGAAIVVKKVSDR